MNADQALFIFLLVLIGYPVCFYLGKLGGRSEEFKRLKPNIDRMEAAMKVLQDMTGTNAPATTEWPVAVGHRFTYLGLVMVCTSHYIPLPSGMSIPGMVAEYVDADGLLRIASWTTQQFAAIKAEIDLDFARSAA